MAILSLAKKPRRLLVSGHEVTVIYKKSLPSDPGRKTRGLFETDPFKITILNDKNWRATLHHEIMHMILFISGLDEILEEAKEEAVVKALEFGMQSILIIENQGKDLYAL